MREILFRGKRIDNGEWVEGKGFLQEGFTCWLYGKLEREQDWFDDWVKVDPSIAGQYTGLKDKNGRRIFEGDICQHEKTGRTVSVSWHGTMAVYVWSKRIEDSNLFDFGELFRVHDKYVVIGNIHDNPELLEVQGL